jgi:hypothetical protein
MQRGSVSKPYSFCEGCNFMEAKRTLGLQALEAGCAWLSCVAGAAYVQSEKG